MGFDVYMGWKGQTEKEKKAQYTGYSVVHGRVGYLRESYEQSVSALEYFISEAFTKDKPVKILSKILRRRLKKTLLLVRKREIGLYQSGEKTIKLIQKSFSDFVKLAERKEKETGRPVTVEAR